MYGFRDTTDLTKLVIIHFKAKFGLDLICIINDEIKKNN